MSKSTNKPCDFKGMAIIESELFCALHFFRIVTTHVTPTFGHELFLFQNFGTCNKESLLAQLSEEDKKWVQVELQAEQKFSMSLWYNIPATILALLVWKVSMILTS